MSNISTHILDTSSGKPASGVKVRLFTGGTEIGSGITDANGRCSALLPPEATLTIGIYSLVFETNTLFSHGFYPEVSVSIRVPDPASHYHVPLLISPFGYTTYRGS